MEGKTRGTGVLAVSLVGLLPALEMAAKPDDFEAFIAFIMWILIGAVIVKILVIFAGVS